MSCYLEVIDKSPNVEPPYCRYYGGDYYCATCMLTEKEKDEFMKKSERFQDLFEKQDMKRRRGKNNDK